MKLEEAATRLVDWLHGHVLSSGRGDFLTELNVEPSGLFWLGRLAPEDAVVALGLGERGERLDPCAVGLTLRVEAALEWSVSVKVEAVPWLRKAVGDWVKAEKATVHLDVTIENRRGPQTLDSTKLSAALQELAGSDDLRADIRAWVRETGDGFVELTITLVNTSSTSTKELRDTNRWSSSRLSAGTDAPGLGSRHHGLMGLVTQMPRAKVLLAVAGAGAVWIAGVSEAVRNGAMSEGPLLNAAFLVSFAAGLSYILVGGLLAWLRPRNPSGWLLLGVSIAIDALLLGGWASSTTTTQVGRSLIAVLRPLLVWFVLAYPVGILQRRDRPLVAFFGVTATMLVVAAQATSTADGLIGVVDAESVSDVLHHLHATLFNPVMMGVLAALVVWRLRRLPTRSAGIVRPVYIAFVVIALYDAVGGWVFSTWGQDLKFDSQGLTLIGGADLLTDWSRFLLVPVAVAVAMGRRRHADSGEAVVEVDASRNAESLARVALGDSSARLLYRYDGRWLDSNGESVGSPQSESDSSDRVLSYLDSSRDVVLEHDAAVLERPDAASAAMSVAATVAANEQLVGMERNRMAELRRARRDLIRTSDETRIALERDLHDGAQQYVVAATINLALVRSKGSDIDPERATDILGRVREMLDLARSDLRRIASGLTPRVLELGLPAALADIAERAPLPVALEYEPGLELPGEVAEAMYYIAAEAVTNAVKHSGASHLALSVQRDERSAVVVISDDGQGSDGLEVGFGLRGMRERVEDLGGEFSVESAPNSGTTVTAAVPLTQENA